MSNFYSTIWSHCLQVFAISTVPSLSRVLFVDPAQTFDDCTSLVKFKKGSAILLQNILELNLLLCEVKSQAKEYSKSRNHLRAWQFLADPEST